MQYIFVHGLGQTPASWDKTIENLSGQMSTKGNAASCICPDLAKLLQNKDANYANLYTAFSECCDNASEPLIICGVSLGGILALHYGIEHPQKVKALILIGAQYKMPKKLLAFQNIIFRFMPQAMFEQMGFGKKEFMELSKSMMELDFGGSLDKITCPVLVICGEKDKANKKAAQELAKCLTHAELCMISDAGHEVNVDAPERLAEKIVTFIE